jgi:putative DNA primase/helicase
MAASLIRDYPWTDAGNSERLIREHGENVRYIEAWDGSWIAWKGTRWEVDKGYLYRMMELVARKMYDEADALKVREAHAEEDEGYKKAAKAFARRSESAAGIEATLKLARYRAGVALAHTKLDGNPMILPVRNGTIELTTGSIRNSKREDYATLNIPIKYDPTAKCPTWDRFLRRAMNSAEEMVEFLQRCVGYSFTGSVGEHVLFFNHGPKGMNGKSTFLAIIRELVGGYGAAAPRKLLFQGIGDRHPTELTTLFGKRLVTCSEVPADQVFDEALVKDLTGADRISAHRMREDFWEFDPTHKLWLAGNHKPIILGTDGGIWRRIIFIPWEVTIPDEERDLDLLKKLRAELPGILAWGVRGCLAWQKRRLDPPATVSKATMKYRQESDMLGEFFNLYCTLGPKERITRKALRGVYETFCEEIGAKTLGAQRFNNRLREEGVTEGTVRDPKDGPVHGWHGIGLKGPAAMKAAAKWEKKP